MMTLQEIFDKSVEGVIKQGRQCRTLSGSCRYAGPDNCACGIGQLLPRKMAEEWDNAGTFSITRVFEGDALRKINAPRKLRQLRAIGIPTDYTTQVFLEHLQNAHDRCRTDGSFLEDYRRETRRLARIYDLSTEVLG